MSSSLTMDPVLPMKVNVSSRCRLWQTRPIKLLSMSRSNKTKIISVNGQTIWINARSDGITSWRNEEAIIWWASNELSRDEPSSKPYSEESLIRTQRGCTMGIWILTIWIPNFLKFGFQMVQNSNGRSMYYVLLPIIWIPAGPVPLLAVVAPGQSYVRRVAHSNKSRLV